MRLLHHIPFRFALLAVITGLLWHLLEWKFSGNTTFWHETADDASYYQPAFHLWDTGTWKDNLDDPSAYVQRPPLTGALHFLSRIVGTNSAPYLFFFFALLLHGLAVYQWVKLGMERWNRKVVFASTLFYCLIPTFFGFLSYRISESIEISLCLLAWTQLVNQPKKTILFLNWTLVLWLFRPVLLLFLVPLWINHLRHFNQRTKTSTSSTWWVCLFLMLVTLGWEIRKVNHGFTFGDPHPIYHSDNASIFRPEHAALSALFRNWEYQPERFHALVGNYWEGNLTQGNALLAEYNYQGYAGDFPQDQLQQLLNDYAQLGQAFRTNPRSNSLKLAENDFVQRVHYKATAYTRAHLGQRWIKTPLNSLLLQLKKSHLNLRLFQETWRGTWFGESIRLLSLGVLLLGYLSLFVLLFTSSTWRWLALGALIYLFYLSVIQVMNEDRYFLPAALSGFVCLTALLDHTQKKWGKKKQNK